MDDFTDIIPADLLPEAVREYDRLFGDGTFGRSMASIPCDVGEEQIYVAPTADAAIAAALKLAASLMVCGTCKSDRPACDEEECAWCDNTLRPPSRWQHFKEAVS